jgi:lipoprotein-releasing system permease protein
VNPFARFEWIVALRFMREGQTQSLLIVSGVALGAGVIIFMSALLAGLQSNIVRRTLNFQAPISILPPEQVARTLRAGESAAVAANVQPRSQQLRSVDQWQKVRVEVAKHPEVIGITPVVAGLRCAAKEMRRRSSYRARAVLHVTALPRKSSPNAAGRAAGRRHRHRLREGPAPRSATSSARHRQRSRRH